MLFSKIVILFSHKYIFLLSSINLLYVVLLFTLITSSLFFTSSNFSNSVLTLISISATSFCNMAMLFSKLNSFSFKVIILLSIVFLSNSYFCLSNVIFFSLSNSFIFDCFSNSFSLNSVILSSNVIFSNFNLSSFENVVSLFIVPIFSFNISTLLLVF